MYAHKNIFLSEYFPLLIAVQMWTLGYFMPMLLFLIGDDISSDNKHWENVLTRLDITDYLVASEISVDEVSTLKVVIEEHLSWWTKLYSNVSVIPKFHFLIHTPWLILKFVFVVLVIHECIILIQVWTSFQALDILIWS